MSGKLLTYPIAEKISDEILDELIHYSSYKRFLKLKGEDVNVYVVTYGLQDEDIEKIKEIDETFNIINVEDYLEQLNDFVGSLYDEGKIEVFKMKKYYCDHCNSYYTPNEVNFEEKEIVFNIARVRIGRRLYYIDKIPEGEEPIGVAINEDEELLYVKMDKETWVAPMSMKNTLVKEIEIPESEIKKGKINEIKKNIKLVGYVTIGDFNTGFINSKEEDMYNLQKVISSYTVIYSTRSVVRKATCPKCGEPLQEIVIPKLRANLEEGKVDLSSEVGSYKIPILYCESCGHFEYGVKIKDCPICGNVMELKFFYNPIMIPMGVYFTESEGAQKLAFLHEKRQRYLNIDKILRADGRPFSERTYVIRHKFPEEKPEMSAYLIKKRGVIGNNVKKMDKLRNALSNIVKYTEIYGETEPRDILDNWILYQNDQVKKKFIELIDSGNFTDAFQILSNFVIKDVSHLYIGMKRKEPLVGKVIIDAIKMFYVFDPDFSTSLIKKLNAEIDQLTVENIAEIKGMEIAKDVIRKIMRFRKDRDMPRREPIKKIVFVTEHADEIKDFTSRIMKFTNVLVFNSTEKWDEMDLTIEPNVEAISRMYRAWAPKIAFLLKRKNVKDVMSALNTGGYTMGIEGFIIRITPDMVKYVEKVPKGYLKIKAKYGDLYVNSERDITTMRIRMINEVIRRINYMRKDIEIEYDDVIDVSISTDEYVLRILKGYVDEIKERTRARNVDFKYEEYAYVVEWPIMDFDVIIGINPLFKKWVIKAFQSIPGIAENKAEMLFHMGYGSIYELMQASPSELAEIPGFSVNFANKIKDYIYNTAFKPKKEGNSEFCPFCGAELSEEDDFCPRCGAPIRVEMEKQGIEEGNVYVAWGDFSKIASLVASKFSDEKKLLITKEDPDEVKKEYNLKNTTIAWISYVPMSKSIKPKELDKLKEIIEKNLGKGVKVIMWDAFDFMNAINGFESMLEFLKEIKEDIKITKAILLFNVEEVEEEENVEKLSEIIDGKI